MNKEEIIRKIKELKLPEGEYIVFGSGPLAVNGIRETNDIDLLLSQNLFKQLKTSGWKEKVFPSGDIFITYEECEGGSDWKYGSYNPTLEELLKTADYFDGVPFANLEEVIKWKTEFGREKDLKDVELIKKYLKRIT
jgi:hypothetical protein